MLEASTERGSRRALTTAILILAGLFIAMWGVMPWDLTLSMTALRMKIPGDLRRLLQFAEVFAHTLGCAVILGALLWLDVKNRSKLLRAAAFVCLCGSLANLAKYMIPRTRPYNYMEDFPSTSWETFGSPLTRSWFDESIRSFPSGHSATAAAMAIGLSYAYPRGRWMFLTIALLAIAQRLFSAAHFASDLVAGFTITTAIACVWLWLAHRRQQHVMESDREPSVRETET